MQYFRLIFLLSIAVFLSGCYAKPQKEHPLAVKGVLDLRNWDFNQDGTLELRGEWEFYWDTLYSYTDFAQSKTQNPYYVHSGVLWKSFPNHDFNLQGKATYHLKILLNNIKNDLDINFEEAPYSAGKVFVNGNLIGSNGKVSINKETYNPSYYIKTKPFKADSIIDLVIQVSNFEHNRSGGIIFNIKLGNAYNIAYLKQKSFIVKLIIIGGIFVVLIYHFAFYLMWSSEKRNLYFSIFSFFILLYFSSLYLLPYFINDFNFIRLVRITGWFFAIPVFTVFVRSIFPDYIRKEFIRILALITIVAYVLYLLKVEYVLDFIKIITIIAEIYVIIAALRILKVKTADAIVFFAGVLFVALSGINDALTHLEVIQSFDVLPFGVFLFLLAQSYILAYRSAKTFRENKEISQKLKDTNKNLEKIVLERTQKIEEQNIRLAELNATKDRFFGIIAHNLRGPVGNWASSLGLLIDTYDRLDDKTKLELITGLKSSTDKTFHLLENLLLWSRIQRKIITYSPQNTDIKDIIDENIEMLKPSADFKNISLIVDLNPQIKAYCDVYMISNVVRNLLSNAIKFTHENGKIYINSAQKNGYVEISVKDTGIGIDESILKNLFKIEHNILSKGTKGETGSGLGLILCKEFIDKHKGEINIQSKQGEGTTVSVKIPQSGN